MAASIVAFAGWVGYASVNVFYRDTMLDARDRRIAELSYAYERLSADYEKSQENFVVASRDLEERYRRLYDMAMKQRTPALPSDTADAAKGGAPAKGSDTNKAARPSVAEPNRAAETKGEVKVATATPPAAVALPSDDPASIEDLEGMLRESKSKPPLPAVKPRDIETRILAVRGQQRELIDELGARTDKSLTLLEKALSRTGLDINAMLARAMEARADVGVGGPLRALNSSTSVNGVALASADMQVDRDMNNLEGKFGRWGDLMALTQRLPLDLPMSGEAEVSSTFGRR
ncbi:MAG: hypothetical protein VW600_16110, partial [Ferrovibrio sp.]